MNNSAALVRLSDRMTIMAHAVDLDLDRDSWAWGFSATLANTSALAAVLPTSDGPTAVEVTLNGHRWTAYVEEWEETRIFGETAFQVSGRSRTAELAAPYAPAKTYLEQNARSAAQLATQELDNTGWTLAWNAPDWIVPAGCWSYESKTPMEAIGLLAAAVGAVVVPDQYSKTITVVPRYPVSPWSWGSSAIDASIQYAMVTRSGGKFSSKPDYNAVWVSGRSQGVMVNVRRQGTAGELGAPMIVDPLVTEVSAGTERGRNVLADTGKQSIVTRDMPLTYSGTLPGLLPPGSLVENVDQAETWRGQVMRCAVHAEWSETIGITQTLEIERHY